MTNHVRHWFEDMGVFFVWAGVLFLLGTLFVGAAVQNPTRLQWTGVRVHAVENGGISYYSYGGENYTLDVSSKWMQPDIVYLNPEEPSDAMLGLPIVRWLEFGSVVGPYSASILVLTFGFARRSRRRRLRKRSPDAGFGTGLDHGTLRRLRDRQSGGADRDEGPATGRADR